MVVAAMGAVLGCSAPARESVPEGLTLFSADSTLGLSGAYREGAHTIYFETLREPEEAVDVGGGKTFGVSARFTNQDGYLLALSIAGHKDPWGSPQQPMSDEIAKERDQDIALVVRAGKALATSQTAAAMASEKAHLVELAQTFDKPIPKPAGDTPYSCSQYASYLAIYRGGSGPGCSLAGLTPADHECSIQTQYWVDSVCNWHYAGTTSYNNHQGSGGTCGQCNYQCTKGPTYRSGMYTGLTCDSTNYFDVVCGCDRRDAWGNCYDFAHNCREDTWVEYQSIINNSDSRGDCGQGAAGHCFKFVC